MGGCGTTTPLGSTSYPCACDLAGIEGGEELRTGIKSNGLVAGLAIGARVLPKEDFNTYVPGSSGS